jgi:hypothetical protein
MFSEFATFPVRTTDPVNTILLDVITLIALQNLQQPPFPPRYFRILLSATLHIQVLLATCLLARFILRPWRWRRQVPPKRRLNFTGPHGIISQFIFCNYKTVFLPYWATGKIASCDLWTHFCCNFYILTMKYLSFSGSYEPVHRPRANL